MATPEVDSKSHPKPQHTRRKTLFSFDPTSKRDTAALEADSDASKIVFSAKATEEGEGSEGAAVPSKPRSGWMVRGASAQRKKSNQSKKHESRPSPTSPGSLARGLSFDSSQRVHLATEPASVANVSNSSSGAEGGRLGTSLDYSGEAENADSSEMPTSSNAAGLPPRNKQAKSQPNEKKKQAKQFKLKGHAGPKRKGTKTDASSSDKGEKAQPPLAPPQPLTKDLPPTEEWPHYPLLVTQTSNSISINFVLALVWVLCPSFCLSCRCTL